MEIVQLRDFGNLRRLSGLLALAVADAHDAGNEREAIEYLKDLRSLARAVDAVPFVVYHQIAIVKISSPANGQIEQMAPDLGGAAPGVRQEVEALTRRLLDQRGFHRAFERIMLGERAYISTVCDAARRGRRHDLVPKWYRHAAARALLGPLLLADQARVLRHVTSVVEASRQANYPAARAKLTPLSIPSGWLGELTHPFSSEGSSFDRYLSMHFLEAANRRMAATALAIRLYELDHGRRPDKLADLVDRYLPAVPGDPFDPSRKISYLPKAKRPLLYCVSENGIDDGGKYAENSRSISDWFRHDWPFFLDGDRPGMAPTRAKPPAATNPATP